MTDDTLRFPVGRFQNEASITPERVREAIAEIAALPERLRVAVDGLDDARLDTTYREGGWTVRQVVHHLPDSHMNAYVRIRLALTQDTPAIMPYDEQAWAELPDARYAPLDGSLTLLTGLHRRWSMLLEQSPTERLQTSAYRHPEMGTVSVDRAAALYAWHGRHHLAHVTRLRDRMNW